MSVSAAPTFEALFIGGPMQPLRFNDNAVAGPSTVRTPSQATPTLSRSSSTSSRSASPEVEGKRKGKGKVRAAGRKARSSLSRMSSTGSIQRRVAESARQAWARVEVARVRRDSGLYDYLVRGLRFIMNCNNPFGWLARPAERIREGILAIAPIHVSPSSLLSPANPTSDAVVEPRQDLGLSADAPDNEPDVEAEEQTTTSGDAPAVAQGGNTTQTPDADDADSSDGEESSADTELVEEDENTLPSHHEPLQYVGQDPFSLPELGPYWTRGRIAQSHECRMLKLAEAENLARKRMEQERFNEAQNAWILKTFGEVDGRRLLLDFEWMDFAEKAHERMVNGIIDMNDYEERSRLLLSGSEAALQMIIDRDDGILRELENKQSEAAKMLGLDRLDSRQVRDKNIKFRRIRQARFHPYSSCVRPARKVTRRHFNQSGTWSRPAFKEEEGEDLRPKVDLEELYSRYHDRWAALTDPENEVELTFETVPWPLSHVPQSPEDIISSDILQFVQGEDDWNDETYAVVGLCELRRWMPDRFREWVLRRVSNKEERKKVIAGAEIVHKCLVLMVAEGYKEQPSEAHTPIPG